MFSELLSLIYVRRIYSYLRKISSIFFNNENPIICDLLYKQKILYFEIKSIILLKLYRNLEGKKVRSSNRSICLLARKFAGL